MRQPSTPSRGLIAATGFLIVSSAAAEKMNQVACSTGLLTAYDEVNFAGSGYGGYYTWFCLNPIKIASVLAAEKVLCQVPSLDWAVDSFIDLCTDEAELSPAPLARSVALIRSVAASLTDDRDEAVAERPVVEQGQYTAKENVTAPFLLAQPWFELAYRTANDYDHQIWRDKTNGFAFYGFWAIVVVLGMLNHLLSYLLQLRTYRPFSTNTDPEGAGGRARQKTFYGTMILQKSPVARTVHHWFKAFLLVPSAVGEHHARTVLGCTVPTRLEAIAVFAFWIVNIVLCCVDISAFPGNLYWPLPSQQTWRYVADRTGIAAVANLPVLCMFAGRNNVFIWATGWPYATFNLFHRHIGRIITLEAIAHSVSYTVLYLHYDEGFKGYSADWRKSWFYMGVVSTICMGFLVGSGVVFFRQHTYEIFLVVHVFLSIVIIAGLSSHLSIFDGEFSPYLWPLVAIWCFDRAMRLVRVIYCNIHYDQAADTLRIRVAAAANPLLRPGPGQHFFLYQPFRWKGWEDHPFKLAYWEEGAKEQEEATGAAAAAEVVCKNSGSSTEDEEKSTAATTRTSVAPVGSSTTTADRKQAVSTQVTNEKPSVAGINPTIYEFWVRPRDGWTRSLRDRCLRATNGRKQCTPLILLEGPYGHMEPLWRYDKVLLVACGSGIATMVPYLLDYCVRVRQREARENRDGDGVDGGGSGSNIRTRDVELLWVNRDEGFIRSLAPRELASPLARADVCASFYATAVAGTSTPAAATAATWHRDGCSGNRSSDEDSAETSKAVCNGAEVKELQLGSDGGEDLPDLGSDRNRGGKFTVTYGRPDLALHVERAAREALESSCSLAVMACAPAGMADAVRAAVHRLMRRQGSDGQIEYFEGAFGW